MAPGLSPTERPRNVSRTTSGEVRRCQARRGPGSAAVAGRRRCARVAQRAGMRQHGSSVEQTREHAEPLADQLALGRAAVPDRAGRSVPDARSVDLDDVASRRQQHAAPKRSVTRGRRTDQGRWILRSPPRPPRGRPWCREAHRGRHGVDADAGAGAHEHQHGLIPGVVESTRAQGDRPRRPGAGPREPPRANRRAGRGGRRLATDRRAPRLEPGLEGAVKPTSDAVLPGPSRPQVEVGVGPGLHVHRHVPPVRRRERDRGQGRSLAVLHEGGAVDAQAAGVVASQRPHDRAEDPVDLLDPTDRIGDREQRARQAAGPPGRPRPSARRATRAGCRPAGPA